MKDQDKTRKQLIDELKSLRERFAEVEKDKAEHKQAEQALRDFVMSGKRFSPGSQADDSKNWDVRLIIEPVAWRRWKLSAFATEHDYDTLVLSWLPPTRSGARRVFSQYLFVSLGG
jgi:hypothetical protein